MNLNQDQDQDPAGIRGVVPSRKFAPGDDRAVVPDVHDRPIKAWPLNGTDQPVTHDDQPGLLTDLADHRLFVGLAGLDAATGQRPEASAGIVPAPDQQEPPPVICDDGAYAGNPWHGHGVSIAVAVLDVSARRDQRRYS